MVSKPQVKPHILDYFFIIRPLLLVPMWAYMIFGYFRFAKINNLTEFFFIWEYAPPNFNFLSSLYFYSLIFGAIVVINQIADYETDKLHPNVWLIASDFFPIKFAIVETVILIIIGLSGAILFDTYPTVFFITLIVGLLYSIKPTRFSGRPFWDFIANSALYGFFPFLLGWVSAGGDINFTFLKNCLPYTLLMASGAINSTIQDIEDDAKTGKITTSVKFGAKGALKLSSIILALALLISLLSGDFFCSTLCSIAVIFYIKALLKGSRENYLKTLHIPGPIIVLSAGLQYPLLFPIMLSVLLLSKLYYPWRFNYDYPHIGK